jgi:serine/threonine protein kinase
MASSSSNVVGVHYRVGKKIGEGSFGVLFEGTNILNNQQVAIKFVRFSDLSSPQNSTLLTIDRNLEKAMLRSWKMNTGPTRFSVAVVSLYSLIRRRISDKDQLVCHGSTTTDLRAFITS